MKAAGFSHADEAADILRAKVRTPERWRDLEEWLAQQRRAHTSAAVPPPAFG
ncbi:MAG: hypothetical protein JSU08_11940 [Acidobacteria bacterium]|nr:hypothetical protein [Acidobacteriota bacterium]